MPEQAFAFSERTAQRLARMLKWFEGMSFSSGRPREQLRHNERAFYFAQSSALVKNGNTGSNFTLYGGTTAGSETATVYTSISAYVRKGIVYANVTYILIEINGHLEVLNPTLSGIGKTNAALAKSSGGANKIDIYSGSIGSESSTGSTLTAWNRYADIASGKWVRWAWNDDSGAYDCAAAEC
jgi:hypothetical protein